VTTFLAPFSYRLLAFLTLGLMLAIGPAQAQGLLQKAQQADQANQARQGMVRVGNLRAGLVSEHAGVVPGEKVTLGLRLIHDPHWHTYWRNPGDSGLPTQIEWQLPAGWQAADIEWPAPARLPVGPLASFGFEGDLLLPVALTAPKDLAVGRSVTLVARASWLVCKDVCIPGDALLAITLPVQAAEPPVSLSADAEQFRIARSRTPALDPQRQPQAYLSENALSIVWSPTLQGAPEAAGIAETTGLFFPYVEGLITPSAAQALSQTAQGFRLDIPLGESARRALEEVRQAGVVAGVWQPKGSGPSVVWTASLQSGGPPVATALLNAGQTAEQDAPPRAAGFNLMTLALAVGGALLGGAILNLMPCVFPVIGLKVLSFAQSAHSRAASLKHALIFSSGVVLSFMALALLLIALRAAGEAVGWGFQLQNPWVVMLLALLFVAIAMNLSGVFEMGLLISRLGNAEFANQAPDSTLGAFSSGVLAVVVASPCTAPFMGSAVGFTASASLPETLLVFASLGIGMSLPYLVLSSWPGLLAKLPRPGAWMVRFKQAMAFPMLLAAAWLFWVLATLQGPDSVLLALVSAVLLALALWIYGVYLQPRKGRLTSVILFTLALIGAAWGVVQVAQSEPAPMPQWAPLSPGSSAVGPSSNLSTSPADGTGSAAVMWQPWAPGEPERLQAQGQTVFVDFTASWCISCQANKVRVLQSERVLEAFARQQVVLLRADWTRKDALIANELARHGRSGVPLYLVYSKSGGRPKILSEWLTESEVLNAIR
jgi:thiol:disulfide interchange protein/DsbC/DsbD-like thiol-disulfide interchange protein